MVKSGQGSRTDLGEVVAKAQNFRPKLWSENQEGWLWVVAW